MTRVLRSVLLVAVAITTVIGVASFVLSFAALWELATMAGVPRSLSWLWPVIVDGTILQATISVIALASYPDQARGRRFFWAVLMVAASVSVGANALHAFVSDAGTLPPILSAAMATVAPVSLLAATHGLAVLVRVPTSVPPETPLADAPTREISVPAATPSVVATSPVVETPVPEPPAPAATPAPVETPAPVDTPIPVRVETARPEDVEPEPSHPSDVREEALRLYALGLSAADVADRLDVPKSIVERVTGTNSRHNHDRVPVTAV